MIAARTETRPGVRRARRGAGSRAAPAAALERATRIVPPELLFVAGAVSQYLGAALAVLLFASVPAAGVAWLRVLAAAGALAAWRRPWRRHWTPRRLALCAAFGSALAGMNLAFYEAIDRIPLGTAVAIEFAGPIAVAAVGSRTRRDWGALVLGAAGVLLLADVQVSGSALGVGLALLAGLLWALYIVLGHRVAETGDGVDGLAAGMCFGVLAIAPLAAADAAPAFADPLLLAACVGVGLLSSVVPYALDQVALRRLGRARFALLLAVLPATAVLVGAALLGQVPTAVEALGIAAVIAAVALRSRDDVPAA